MVSISNLIKFMIILTLFLCCQIHATPLHHDNHEMHEMDYYDIFRDLYPIEDDPFYHQQDRRASLRYHPHVLYKKASLKPIIGDIGKYTLNKRNDD